MAETKFYGKYSVGNTIYFIVRQQYFVKIKFTQKLIIMESISLEIYILGYDTRSLINMYLTKKVFELKIFQ